MIFVTVGSQLPFDRLVMAIDEWAGLNKDIEVVVQAGKSNFESKYCKILNYIEPNNWDKLINDADVIIGHAGMGTILKTIERNKPLIIMPREFRFSEIRNDHQLATVSYFNNIEGVYIAYDKNSLFSNIDNVLNDLLNNNCFNVSLKKENLEKLIDELRCFAVTNG